MDWLSVLGVVALALVVLVINHLPNDGDGHDRSRQL